MLRRQPHPLLREIAEIHKEDERREDALVSVLSSLATAAGGGTMTTVVGAAANLSRASIRSTPTFSTNARRSSRRQGHTTKHCSPPFNHDPR